MRINSCVVLYFYLISSLLTWIAASAGITLLFCRMILRVMFAGMSMVFCTDLIENIGKQLSATEMHLELILTTLKYCVICLFYRYIVRHINFHFSFSVICLQTGMSEDLLHATVNFVLKAITKLLAQALPFAMPLVKKLSWETVFLS